MRRCLLLLLLWGLVSTTLLADGPAFDLAGPKVDVHVKRGAVCLSVKSPACNPETGSGFTPIFLKASLPTSS